MIRVRAAASRTAALAGAVLLLVAPGGQAQEVRVMTSGAFTEAFLTVVPEFERTTKGKVLTSFGASMGGAPDSIPSRLERGEPADVVILASDALRRTLLQARSIAYSASASGVYLSTELFQRLGIADQIKGKSRRIESERVGTVVARGDAEIGFQQISELLPVAGIDYVGPLPAEVQRVTVFSAGIATGARNPDAARALVRLLASPAVAPAITKTGLEPVSMAVPQ